jgi:hypothetical protein
LQGVEEQVAAVQARVLVQGENQALNHLLSSTGQYPSPLSPLVDASAAAGAASLAFASPSLLRASMAPSSRAAAAAAAYGSPTSLSMQHVSDAAGLRSRSAGVGLAAARSPPSSGAAGASMFGGTSAMQSAAPAIDEATFVQSFLSNPAAV